MGLPRSPMCVLTGSAIVDVICPSLGTPAQRARREGVTVRGTRRGAAGWLGVIAAATITAPLLGSTGSSAAGAAPSSPVGGRIAAAPLAQPAGTVEVDVMNEAVRGGEPELAINPLNPQNLLLGHTVVANNYANDSFQA